MVYGSPLDEKQLTEEEAREQLCEIGERLWQLQYVEANAGNMTYRLADGRILATPTMIGKGFMKPGDLVLLDLEGNQLAGERRRTSEILVHLRILTHRPDIRCVIHCHPPHATTFAITRTPLPDGIHPEKEIFLGQVPIPPYATPGSPEVADALIPYLDEHTVFILASHGTVAGGRGILDAFWKTEVLEAYCRLIILARSLGEPIRLSPEQMDELLQIKAHFGGASEAPATQTDSSADAERATDA